MVLGGIRSCAIYSKAMDRVIASPPGACLYSKLVAEILDVMLITTSRLDGWMAIAAPAVIG